MMIAKSSLLAQAENVKMEVFTETKCTKSLTMDSLGTVLELYEYLTNKAC